MEAKVLEHIEHDLGRWLAGSPVAAGREPALWDTLREQAPVHRHRGMIVITAYAPARRVMRAYDEFSSDVTTQGDRAVRSVRSATSERDRRKLSEVIAFEAMLMNRSDGAAHATLRAPFAAALVRRHLADMRQLIEAEVHEVTGRFAERGLETAALGRELTGRVTCRLVGAPADDWRQFGEWLEAIGRGRHDVEPGAVGPAHEAWRDLRAYVTSLVRATRNPRTAGPLLDVLTAAWDTAEGPVRATADFVSLLGGQESTATVLSRGAAELLASSEQARLLAERPALAANAVEEAVRYVSPSRSMMRRATRATELNGLQVGEGETVVVVMAAANRDPSVFSRPESFDIERPNANRHLGFGFGRHHCIGVWLARIQLARTFALLAADRADRRGRRTR